MENKDFDSYPKREIDELSEIIEQIKNDDQQAFERFFFQFQPGIYKFLARYLCESESAKDITQDTFIKFWQHRHSLNISKSPKAYLFTIARNLALNYISRNHSNDTCQLSKKENISFLLNPNEEYERQFLIDDFQNAVNELPERCRATFILCKYEGFEYSEIAEILNVSLQTVKNQMNKAIAVLKKLLSSHLE